MKLSSLSLSLVAACFFTVGCAPHTAYYAPPPPGYNAVPPLLARADHEGFRVGTEDGGRDAYNRFGYHPKHDRKFHSTPGYDSSMGPYDLYRDAFRRAYLRGYDQGFHHG